MRVRNLDKNLTDNELLINLKNKHNLYFGDDQLSDEQILCKKKFVFILFLNKKSLKKKIILKLYNKNKKRIFFLFKNVIT